MPCQAIYDRVALHDANGKEHFHLIGRIGDTVPIMIRSSYGLSDNNYKCIKKSMPAHLLLLPCETCHTTFHKADSDRKADCILNGELIRGCLTGRRRMCFMA